MKKRTLHFGFGVDANYVKYAGVLMTNLVVLHPDRELHFHLACDGIEANDRHKLENFRKSMVMSGSPSMRCRISLTL